MNQSHSQVKSSHLDVYELGHRDVPVKDGSLVGPHDVGDVDGGGVIEGDNAGGGHGSVAQEGAVVTALDLWGYVELKGNIF